MCIKHVIKRVLLALRLVVRFGRSIIYGANSLPCSLKHRTSGSISQKLVHKPNQIVVFEREDALSSLFEDNDVTVIRACHVFDSYVDYKRDNRYFIRHDSMKASQYRAVDSLKGGRRSSIELDANPAARPTAGDVINSFDNVHRWVPFEDSKASIVSSVCWLIAGPKACCTYGTDVWKAIA
ncbi:hypothetical protein EVAR_67434_1 [Eumeta japonica]|uniref:Uncharacterized protein n=1 Tax=Eumeta variegata TaxID=151549 RepID=A0A4C2A4J9_EUMVA|nr:hypothetical protein EVAR_67434_1 [Eumeta japonica]